MGDDHDLDKMRARARLVKELATYVRRMPAPESGRHALRSWLHKLDAFVTDTTTMHNDYVNAQPGSDLALAMDWDIVDRDVAQIGRAAKKFGFDSCANVKRWRVVS